MQTMQVRQFLQSRWFLVVLLTFIPGGLLFGSLTDAETVGRLRSLLPSQYVTAFVLLLMSFSLDSRQLNAAFRSPGPVLWAFLINAGLLPLCGWAMMSFQTTADFRVGLMIAACVPSTVAACSVWTRKAGGNDAVSLLTTVMTNGLCFLTVPFWLHVSTSQNVALDTRRLAMDLLLVVLTPTVIGQLMRRIRPAGEFATRRKTPIGVLAQSCILLLVLLSACGAGVQLQQSGLADQLSGIAIVWLTCIGLHVFALAVANAGAILLRMPRADRIGAVISGGQKTLPIGVYLATSPEAFGGPAVVDGQPVPFAVFPMLMFHASQLFIDTLVADRYAREGRLLAAAPTEDSSSGSSSTTAPSSDCDPAHGSPARSSD